MDTHPKTYRGWEVSRNRYPEPSWSAVSPNYDVSYEGPEDGWVDNGQSARADTYAELCEEIDAWFEDNGPPTLREIIAAEIKVGDRYATADRILAAISKATL